ncbi:MAG: orotidine-5'-phosphate decarboxylase [Erysipelotrichaceae bacterium]
MKNDVIIACDFADAASTLAFLDKFQEEKPFVKIGMELFYAEGPSVVREIKGRGHKIFLDLKLCDIPNTVYKAMKNIAKLDVDMTNVHAFGTLEMMKAAKQGLVEGAIHEVPKLIAVTQLTSTSQAQMEADLLITRKLDEVVEHYAQVSKAAGLDGVVCSPLEVSKINAACGSEFLTVTPGIRYADGDQGDQKRVTDPKQARLNGSSFIVVGRPITGATDPVAAYRRVCADFLGE